MGSFGLLAVEIERGHFRKPGIIDWLGDIGDIIGNRLFNIISISMQDDGNATSWLPTDEVIDSILINDLVLADFNESGWVPRINEVVEETKLSFPKHINTI